MDVCRTIAGDAQDRCAIRQKCREVLRYARIFGRPEYHSQPYRLMYLSCASALLWALGHVELAERVSRRARELVELMDPPRRAREVARA